MDFYDQLSTMENEAMRRARSIRKAEQQAAQRFHREEIPPPPPIPPPPVPPPPAPHRPKPAGGLGSLLGGNLFGGELFANADMSTIMMLFLILRSEQSDPLLMLALLYILM
ncbi:MAG: hypothetical protein IJI67_05105 [Clostridia bacterium]|nr:hypothetical protein [Clostridia bacterium]